MAEASFEVVREKGIERVELSGLQLTLGRASENTICFPDDTMVSRRHAVLTAGPEGWALRDAGSVNGTFVNGDRLTAPRVLKSGDRVTLGTSRLVFRGNAGPAPPMSSARPAEPLARPAPAAPPGPRPVHPTGGQGRGELTGVVRRVERRRERNGHDVLVFELDRDDGVGNRLPPVTVQLSPYHGGQVNDGEEVEVVGTWVDGTLRAKTLFNLETGSEIITGRRWEYIVLAGLASLLLVLLLAIYWMTL